MKIILHDNQYDVESRSCSKDIDESRSILLAVWSIGCLPNRKPDGKFKKWERNFSISMSCGYMILYHFPKTNQHGK